MEASEKRKDDIIDIDKPPAPKRQSNISVFLEYSTRKILLLIQKRNPIRKINWQEVYRHLQLKSENQTL